MKQAILIFSVLVLLFLDVRAQAQVAASSSNAEMTINSSLSTSETSQVSDSHTKRKPLLGDLAFGPSITPIAAPLPLLVGLDFKYKDILGFGVNSTLLPKFAMGENDQITFKYWDVRARWFVKDAFFIGLGFGQEGFVFDSTIIPGIADSIYRQIIDPKYKSTNEVMHMDFIVTHFDPHVGFKWNWDSGIFMGIDLGWQIVSQIKELSGIGTSLTTDSYTPSPRMSVLYGMPMVSLINAGWLF
jgi:hypothetical protein